MFGMKMVPGVAVVLVLGLLMLAWFIVPPAAERTRAG
jgi:hypothetical protein